jgi:hypothetical protein
MPNTVTSVRASLPLVGFGYEVTAITNTNGSTANSLTLTGIPEDFVPQGLLIFPISRTTGGKTPQAFYAAYDASTLQVNPSDSTQVLVDVYVMATTSNPLPELLLLLY